MQDALCNTYLACLLFPFQLWLWSFFRDLFTRSLPLLGTIITGLVHQKSTFAVFAAVNVFCPFVPFNLFCQLVRHSASVRRALLHFFFFLLIVVAAAELSPLFLGLFSTFSLRLFGLLRHFEGRPPRYAPAPVVPVRPPVVCPSAQPLPPAIIRLASRTLSYRCFPVFNSCSPLRLSSSPGGHLPGPLHQIAYHFDDGTDNIKGLTDSKEGGKSEFLKN